MGKIGHPPPWLGVRLPNRPKTVARNPTIPRKVTDVSTFAQNVEFLCRSEFRYKAVQDPPCAHLPAETFWAKYRLLGQTGLLRQPRPEGLRSHYKY